MDENALFVGFAAATLRSTAPLLWALVGETLSQRAAVINLGTEGQMLVGAATAFGITATTGQPWLGLAGAALAGLLLSAVHAGLCLKFKANQFASGISVWMLGFGLSALFGAEYVGRSISGFAPLAAGHAEELSWLPTFMLSLTTPTVLSLVAAVICGVFLFWTRAGLVVRAVGESPTAARIAGIRVGWVQGSCVLVGGGLSGVGGGMLSVDTAQTWAEGMSQGRGLMAVGLVIVARWNPMLAILAAMLFGGAEAMALRAQSAGSGVSAHLLHALPYVACLVVFTLSCVRGASFVAPGGLRAVLSREGS